MGYPSGRKVYPLFLPKNYFPHSNPCVTVLFPPLYINLQRDIWSPFSKQSVHFSYFSAILPINRQKNAKDPKPVWE